MTRDPGCVHFLQWALPRLGYRWAGFRRVRRQVCRRVRRRYRDLGLADFEAYARRLDLDPAEWDRLDRCCRITISRFYRDRALWEAIGDDVLHRLYRQGAERDPPLLRAWSAGCGAGEEPYSVAMLVRLGPTALPDGVRVEIVGTDLDPHQLERARRAVYPESSLRDLPVEWCRRAFVPESGGNHRLLAPFREDVEFLLQDIRHEAPEGCFDLVLCRNLVFTYFDAERQARSTRRLLDHLAPRGWLALGSHEALPEEARLVRHRSGAPLFGPGPPAESAARSKPVRP